MQPTMPQIETIVMLMLENRSLDTVLGWLYLGGAAQHAFPDTSSTLFDGIPAGASNAYKSTSYSPAQGTQAMHQPCRVPRWDPYEPFENVEVQLFADGYGNMPPDPWSQPAPMTGFAYDFHPWYAVYVSTGEVMGAYTKAQLPVLYGLAENFAVSDRWFASVPTQTNANRAFSICGTSLGGVDNGTPNTYDVPTVFNAITGSKSWGVYWQYDGYGAGDPGNGPCYTADIFPHVGAAAKAGLGTIDTYTNFLSALQAGDDIPNFCYLEPYWGGGKGDATGNDFVGLQGNDYHPPAWIGPAESGLNNLYDALRSSKQWDRMLFIITFDEHGGNWDHVSPTVTVAPDSNTSLFDFTTLGVRVPTILVSPYVDRGTVFRAPAGSAYDFDHTSFIATILGWAGVDRTLAGLGQRVAVAAPTFEGVLTDSPILDTPSFTVPADYAGQGGGLGPHLLGVGHAGISIDEFRRASEDSVDVDEFQSRLAALADRVRR
jgi:phospholipase C